MINIQDKGKCSGCYACEQICPKQCITMKVDAEGFWYPSIDEKLCIGCGLCEKKCPILHPPINKVTEENVKAYAAVNHDENVRLKSSSGGLFTLIAAYVIERDGVVFGAAFDDKFNVIHRYVDKAEDLELLRGSKYVQSKIGDTYRQAEDFLKKGRLVLFTGTPCQIEGLRSFLAKDYENLYTQDIICHGVPSPMIWKKYVEYREKTAKSNANKVYFRNKKYGWKTFSVVIEFVNNTKYVKKFNQDVYMKAFLRNLTLRPSCYQCSFKKKYRNSDYTLADFWGVQNILPQMDDDKGTSLIFVNSEKGYAVLEEIKKEMSICPVVVDDAIANNSSMIKSVNISPQRDEFVKKCQTEDWKALEKAFMKKSYFDTLIQLGKKVARKILREIKRR